MPRDHTERARAASENRVREAVENAITSVRNALASNEALARIPGHEANAEEAIIATEQELALLEAEHGVITRSETSTPDGRRFLHEATAIIRELADEEGARRGGGRAPAAETSAD